MRKAFWPLLLLLVLIGCGKPKVEEWQSKIQVGMTPDEVEAIAGVAPGSAGPDKWFYWHESADKLWLIVHFEDGKVSKTEINDKVSPRGQ